MTVVCFQNVLSCCLVRGHRLLTHPARAPEEIQRLGDAQTSHLLTRALYRTSRRFWEHFSVFFSLSSSFLSVLLFFFLSPIERHSRPQTEICTPHAHKKQKRVKAVPTVRVSGFLVIFFNVFTAYLGLRLSYSQSPDAIKDRRASLLLIYKNQRVRQSIIAELESVLYSHPICLLLPAPRT